MLSDIRTTLNRWAEVFYAKQFGKNERIQFYESLMGILEDGVPLEEALLTVAKAFSDNGLKLHPVSLACRDIAQKVKGGKSLTISCDGWVPYDENSLIASGEDTGNLVQAFRDCVRIIEVRQRISKLVASATVFPSVVMVKVMPLLTMVTAPFQRLDSEVPLMLMPPVPSRLIREGARLVPAVAYPVVLFSRFVLVSKVPRLLCSMVTSELPNVL